MNTKKEKYLIAILRKDGNHVFDLETENFEEAKKQWSKLIEYWESCIKEHKPFIVTTTQISAFDPSLIYEIVIRPSTTLESDSSNPYKKRMMNNGLNKMFGGPDILDSGFSY